MASRLDSELCVPRNKKLDSASNIAGVGGSDATGGPKVRFLSGPVGGGFSCVGCVGWEGDLGAEEVDEESLGLMG